MSRWKAGAIHLSISITIYLGLLAVIALFLYPGVLFSIDGGWQGLRLVISVDLIAGPLLTLIIFKSGKQGLKFDLACIAILQAACMTAGMWAVYSGRPLALVLAYDTIYSVDVKEFREFGRDPQMLDSIPGAYPKLVYIELPESDVAAEIASIRAQFIGDPLYMQTENYRGMPPQPEATRAVFRVEAATRRQVNQSVLGQLGESCALSRFISSVGRGFVCFDTETHEITKFFEEDSAPTGTVDE